MLILDYLKAYRSLITFLAILLAPRVLPWIINLLTSRKRPSDLPPPPRHSALYQVSILVLLPAAYHLYHLIYPPYDLFISNHVPILTPNTIVRQILLPATPSRRIVYPPPAAEDSIELLFQKLHKFDTRFDYARFGHSALLNCVWCENTTDYAIYSLPGILAPYVASALFLGVLGWRRLAGDEAVRRVQHWRFTLGVVIGALAVGEMALRYCWPMQPVNGDTTHLSSTLFTVRNAALLLLPLVESFLPLPAAPPNFKALAQTLQHTRNTIRMTGISRTALMRDEGLRRQWNNAAEEETERVRAARSDSSVRQAVVDGHLPLEDVRQSSRRWVRDGWSSLVRVEG